MGRGVLRRQDGRSGWLQCVEAVQGRVAANEGGLDDGAWECGGSFGRDGFWRLRLSVEAVWGGSIAIDVAGDERAVGPSATAPAGGGERGGLVISVRHRPCGPERGVHRSDETSGAGGGH